MTAAARTHLVPIDQIVGMLAQRIELLVRDLLPGGKRAGPEWVCDDLSGRHPGTAVAVHLTGAKAGLWGDFRAEIFGDALDLVAQCRFAGDKGKAISWSKSWLGLDSMDPARLAAVRRQVQVRAEAADAEDEAQAEKSRAQAQAIWLSALPGLAGSPVEAYLAGRGIDLASFDRPPRAIRFHPALWCAEADTKLPAMVTAVVGRDGRHMATHRTWLAEASPGDWRKARLDAPKKVLGRFAGGQIRLSRGAGGQPMAKALPDSTVDITEGIEDGLTVAMADETCRVVAAISLSNLGNLVFPPAVTTLRIWRQNDTHPAAIAAYQRAIELHMARGLVVLEVPMPEGTKDVNDLLCGVTANG